MRIGICRVGVLFNAYFDALGSPSCVGGFGEEAVAMQDNKLHVTGTPA